MTTNNPFEKYEYITDKDKQAEPFKDIPPIEMKTPNGEKWYKYHKFVKHQTDPIIEKTINKKIQEEKYLIINEEEQD